MNTVEFSSTNSTIPWMMIFPNYFLLNLLWTWESGCQPWWEDHQNIINLSLLNYLASLLPILQNHHHQPFMQSKVTWVLIKMSIESKILLRAQNVLLLIINISNHVNLVGMTFSSQSELSSTLTSRTPCNCLWNLSCALINPILL